MSEIALVVDKIVDGIKSNAKDISNRTNLSQEDAERFLLDEIVKQIKE